MGELGAKPNEKRLSSLCEFMLAGVRSVRSPADQQIAISKRKGSDGNAFVAKVMGIDAAMSKGEIWSAV